MFKNISLTENTILQAAGFEIELKPQKLSMLDLPSGELVVCDPLSMPETEPYTVDLPKGKFPIYSLLANLRDEERLAFLVVEFTKEDAKKWDILSVPGEEIDWHRDRRPGFIIETSYLAMMDRASSDILIDREYFEDEEDAFEKQLSNGLRKSRKKGIHPFFQEELEGGNEIFAIWVDPGGYTGYVGYSDSGEVARLMFDFSTLDFVISPRGFFYRAR